MEVYNLWERLRPRLQAQIQQGLSVHQVAAFCKANPDTVRDWNSDKHPPQGERLLRLWHLLALKGSDSPELAEMPAFNRLLSELIAFGVINVEEACGIAGVKHSQSLFKVTRGQPAMRPSLDFATLKERYGSRLERTKRNLGRMAVQQVVTPPPAADEHEIKPQAKPLDDLTATLVDGDSKVVLATLLGAALPLARRLDSQDVTAQERAAFRDLVGQEILFELSNRLNSLCSERARTSGR